MSLRIQNNIAAMTAHRNLTISDAAMGRSLERLSSGFRINSAKDDAAGMAISQKFRANIASFKVAQRNITEANSFLQTAEGGMDTIGNILTRMKELATQSASEHIDDTSRGKINDEFTQLYEEIGRIVATTQYGSTTLIDGTNTSIAFQIGAENNANNRLTVSLADLSDIGLASTAIDTATDAQTALDDIDAAIDAVSNGRGAIGASQNRLTYASANLQITVENLTASESVIRDVDMAAEMTTFTKHQIFMQAGTAMLAQANMAPQNVLSLFG